MKHEENNFPETYTEVISKLIHKNGNIACGDLVTEYRTPEQTLVLLTDGIGSGVKANMAAHLTSSRFIELIKKGFSTREAMTNIVKTMHKARIPGSQILFAAFTVVHILNDGTTTLLSFESPPAICIEHDQAYIPEQRYFTVEGELVGESVLRLESHKKILLTSDGIPQAGIGEGLAFGWEVKGVLQYINSKLKQGFPVNRLPGKLVEKAVLLSGNRAVDDTSAALVSIKKSKVANLLTGPPLSKKEDPKIVKQFIEANGLKIVCGSTTAQLVSRETGKELKTGYISPSFSRPPEYFIEGIEMVTEGAVVLNQLYNILDQDMDTYEPGSCVSELAIVLNAVDIIIFWMGKADNPGHDNISFTQLGIKPRKEIVPCIITKLRKMGKLVTIKYF